MNHDDGDRVGSPNLQAILAELVSLSPQQQRERIERLGLSEQELGELLSRIGHAASTGGGLPDEPSALLPQLGEQMREVAAATDPQLVGDYRIVRKINAGGMGIVYEARHTMTDQQVALKLIRPGFMTPHMQQRFQYETRLLAKLNDPGIAKIHNAGIWDGGAGPQPYFAMEYIEGKPLDQFLKENRPKLKQRQLVKLFHAICEAVQHAHAKGIVHRDLKPDNILITADGKPKVLDFGVAFAIDADQQVTTMRTEPGQLVGTIPYMAPEQIRGQVDEVEQATDVYTLGVIGYEIFADHMPYRVKELPMPQALAEAHRIICEDEPSRLSRINKSVRGDVETIVQKAMEKDKRRRYFSAGELASDVHRYLEHEPITARPPSTLYSLRKFARRNRMFVGGVLAVMVTLVIGAAVSIFFAIHADVQRREAQAANLVAEEVNDFFNGMLASADPAVERGRELTVKALVDTAAASIGEKFPNQPLVEARIRATLAATYRALGRPDLSLPHSAMALDLLRKSRGHDHSETGAAMGNYAALLMYLDRHQEAEPLVAQVLNGSRRQLGNDSGDTILQISNYATLLLHLGRIDEAEQFFVEGLERAQRVFGHDDEQTLRTRNNLAYVLNKRGRADAAEQLYRDVYQRRRRLLGDDDPATMKSAHNWATVLHKLGRTADAEAVLRTLLPRRIMIQGPDHSETVGTALYLAMLLVDHGEYTEAEKLVQDAIERRTRILGPDHRDTLEAQGSLVTIWGRTKRLQEAEELGRYLLERRRQIHGANHFETLLMMGNYASILDEMGRLQDAERLFLAVLDGHRQLYGPDHPFTVASLNNLAQCLDRQGRISETIPLFREVYQKSSTVEYDAAMRARLSTWYGVALVKCREYAIAEAPLLDAWGRLRETDQSGSEWARNVCLALIDLYRSTNRSDQASRWRAELSNLNASTRPSTTP